MATIRLQVDGADALVDAETIEMPVRRLDGRPRYVVGLVIAVATAAVAIGALGPRVDSASDSALASACEPLAVVAANLAVEPSTDPGVGPSAAPWWRPGPRVWVDPQSGRLRQEQPADRRMTDDRGRHR